MTPSTKPRIPEHPCNRTGRNLGADTLSLRETKIDKEPHSKLPSKQVAKPDWGCNEFVPSVEVRYSLSSLPSSASAKPVLCSTVASSYM